MRRALLVLSLTALAAGLSVCGDKGTPSGPAKGPGPVAASPAPSGIEAAVRARFAELLEAQKAGDNSKLAPFVVYRGRDEGRKWKDVCNYVGDEDKVRVDSFARQLGEKLAAGPIVPESFSTEKESEGEWLLLHCKSGGKEVTFAFLKIKDTLAVGDID
jgi:hypothetical protein